MIDVKKALERCQLRLTLKASWRENMQHVALADVLDEIRSELKEADRRAKISPGGPVMSFEDCEVEFAVTWEKSGEGGLKIYVINLGAGAKQANSNTVRIKFKALSENGLQAESRVEFDDSPIERQP